MCGIAGIFSNSKSAKSVAAQKGGSVPISSLLDRMIGQLRHRGPDDQGVIVLCNNNSEVGLGHTRLAILDLSSAGHQPMKESHGKLLLTYNGEVYNYRELRRELHSEAEEWLSQTDTEVILRLYKHYGIDSLKKLRGMFALALWDGHQNELFLARDHFGIKPLYYYSTKNLFVFSSEIRALLSSGLVPRKLDIEGLTSYLRFGAVESPLTIIDGVKSVPPGHYLCVRRTDNDLQIELKDYAGSVFELPSDIQVTSRNEAVAILREKLEESIKLHLVSDVPLATFLSGGIDSSAIVAMMNRVTNERPKTFNVTFAEKEFNEDTYARLIAKRFSTDHHEIMLSEDALLEMLPGAFSAMDQPTIDGINTYVISRAVKQAGITVALSGLGGDELFAGYPSFRRVQKLRNLAAIPDSVRQATARAGQRFFGNSVQQRKAWHLLAGGGTPHSAYTISRQLFSWEEIAVLLDKERLFAQIYQSNPASLRNHQSDPLNAVSVYELQGYMANMLLRDTDQMSMAHSLEVRVPFVDSIVVPFVLSLPGKWKLDAGRPKPLLVDAVADLLPQEIWQRPKMGFTLPFERWMHSTLRSDIEKAFSDAKGLGQVGITAYGRSIWNTFQKSAVKERWSRSWAIYVLRRWCDNNLVSL
jgi:asparagine synthase (glutamine-hydrolysing)